VAWSLLRPDLHRLVIVSFQDAPEVSNTADGGATITICEDQAGTEESVRRAAEWVRQNVQGADSPPEITEGEVGLHFAK
jgi:hypothetical protein